MKDVIYLNDGWLYSPKFDKKMVAATFKGPMEKVRLPHTVAVTPFNAFSVDMYQKVSAYRTTFATQEAWAGKKVLLTFEGAAHQAEVFFNGKSLAVHNSGYTAFTVDLTEHLVKGKKNNVLVVKLDSRESLDFPPFGYVVDYMTYGGIYRDVYLTIKNPVYIEDVFVKTKGNHFTSEVTLNTDDIPQGYSLTQKIVHVSEEKEEPSAEIASGISSRKTLTAADASPVLLWDVDNPSLYVLTTELRNEKNKVVDTHTVRFGFRDIRFDETGFYLNGKKCKLRGLNRHQSYPYVGYAMPESIQREDADILKFELGLNEVRTSHYPQSQHFIDRCDEVGLLVFTEIPGWQHIGTSQWQAQAVENVREMIMQYRNHPSIFLWGVRINESPDNDALYEKTNALAHELDDTRVTGGVRCIKQSNLLEDVYTYNDFSHTGDNDGILHKNKVTKTNKGYMVTEYNGHMFPTKAFDCEAHRTQHAERHAKVLDTVASYDDVAGASGWCAFDYNTHKDFGSGDMICYHGVMDMFRNPKLAAAVYKSQGDASVVGDVLEVSSSMDIGEYPGGAKGDVWIYTNADCVRMFVNTTFIKEYTRDNSPYKHLAHGPILVDDYIGSRLVNEDHIPAEKAETLKMLLHAISKYGEKNLPLAVKLKALPLFISGTVNREKVTALYGKYIGNWGGQTITYRFEAYRNGKLVKTVIKSPGKPVYVSAQTTRSQLVEKNSYDVAAVHLKAEDENGNVNPFYQEAVSLKTEGALELIGPSIVSLKGGMAGTYVKSVGKTGKGALVVTDVMGNELKVPFSVKVQRS